MGKNKALVSLGIETTAEKLGIGIVNESGEILANVVVHHEVKEGIHPREVAQKHADSIANTIKKALEQANLNLSDINLVSFSQGPGLGPCLRVGAMAARTIALKNKIPIVGVNHCIAHIEIGKLLTEAEDPLMVYASGGNTQVIAYHNRRYRVFGETLDIALGNCLDQFARKLNLGFPGGPIIEKLAKKGKYIALPYIVKGMDLSYSGLLTAAVDATKKNKISDVCFSLQETAFAMLCEVAERAIAYTEKKELLVAGGVCVNKRLQEMLRKMCRERKCSFFAPENEFLGDNGAMVAWLGILMFKSGIKHRIEETVVKQRYRTDEVEVRWI